MSALTLPLTVDGTPSVAGKADGVAGSRVAAGDGPAEAGTGPEHDDGVSDRITYLIGYTS
jgi:hypothetical protein